MSDKVKVMRILIYEGNREWVENTISMSSVPLNGTKELGDDNKIKSAIMEQFPEIIEGDN